MHFSNITSMKLLLAKEEGKRIKILFYYFVLRNLFGVKPSSILLHQSLIICRKIRETHIAPNLFCFYLEFQIYQYLILYHQLDNHNQHQISLISIFHKCFRCRYYLVNVRFFIVLGGFGEWGVCVGGRYGSTCQYETFI